MTKTMFTSGGEVAAEYTKAAMPDTGQLGGQELDHKKRTADIWRISAGKAGTAITIFI